MSTERTSDAGSRADADRPLAAARSTAATAPMPPGALDAAGLRRFLRGATLIFFAIGPPYLALWAAVGDVWMVATILAAEVVNAWAWLKLRRGGSLTPVARAGVMTFSAVIIIGVVRAGGIMHPTAAWLITLPLYGGFIFGSRGAWIGGALTAGTALAMAVAELAGVPPATRVPNSWSETFHVVQLAGAGATILLLNRTWRRQVQRERRQRAVAEEGVQRAVERMQDGIFILERDPAGREGGYRTLMRNPAAEAIVRCLRDGELDLADWFERLPPEQRLARLFLDGHDGQHLELRHPVTGHDYEVTVDHWAGRLILTVRDVTHHAETEAELRRARNDALEASRAKSEFLANMSHEIRTPMNGIIGLTETALRGDLDHETRECLEALHGCADAMLGTLNNLLDLAQIESGRMELCSAEFEPRALADALHEEFMPAAHADGLKWRCTVDDDVPAVLVGDEQRLQQVLARLVDNAFKFTREGGVELNVEAETVSEEHARVRFSVCDTGCGFAEDQLPLLLQSFRQADASRTRARDGIGLGLTLAHEVVQRMGGTLEAVSHEGRGSCFSFSLDCSAPTARASGRLDLQSLVGRRVLLLDDQAANLRVLAGQVRRMGLRYETCRHPQEALTLLTESATSADPFHALISDQRMPVMSGMELGQRICADEALDGLAMILLSSRCERGDARLARTAGFHALLQKPVKYLDLKHALLQVVAPAAQPASAASAAAQRRAPQEAAPAHAGGPRILLAEDNDLNRKLATRLLEREGYRVDAAANGREAVERARSGDYDLVLMDCMMPEMDGYEATRGIRKLGGDTGQVPIVAITANAMLGDRERCLDAGMNDYLTKPLRREAFLPVVRRWLGPRETTGR